MSFSFLLPRPGYEPEPDTQVQGVLKSYAIEVFRDEKFLHQCYLFLFIDSPLCYLIATLSTDQVPPLVASTPSPSLPSLS